MREEKDSYIKKWIGENWRHPAFCDSGKCEAAKIQEEWLELRAEITSLQKTISENNESQDRKGSVK